MASRKTKSDVEREKVIQNRCQELLKRMIQDEDNKYCVDCDAKGPRWVSWNLGIFVCIRCAGIHRNLGVHISKVKSVNLDSWTPHQVACMQIMGNSKARAVYEANVPEGFRRPQNDSQLEVFIRAKYEKKKYIAREWVPTKAPELPDGWTALIEAEKQKKDIRSIVLPSHSNNSSTSEEIVKRERQSPKEVAKKSDQKSPNILEKSTPKSSSLDSEFDLLSLSKPNNTPSAKTTVVQEPAKSSAVTDLLGLGDSSGGNEFNDFVGPSTITNQNGTPSTTSNNANTNATSNQNSFFEDFSSISTNNSNGENQAPQKQTMSKDSIMALFNQKPSTGAAPPPISGGGVPPGTPTNTMFGAPQQPPQGFMGGMQIPANFGLGSASSSVGGMSNFQQLQQTQQQPLQGQHFAPRPPQQPQQSAAATFAAFNNPFLGMVQPDSGGQNIFGGNGFTTTTGQNFLQ